MQVTEDRFKSWLSVQQLADATGRSRNTITLWMTTGLLGVLLGFEWDGLHRKSTLEHLQAFREAVGKVREQSAAQKNAARQQRKDENGAGRRNANARRQLERLDAV